MGILVADRSKSHQACFWPAQSLVLYLGQPRCMPLLVRTRFELRQEENDLCLGTADAVLQILLQFMQMGDFILPYLTIYKEFTRIGRN